MDVQIRIQINRGSVMRNIGNMIVAGGFPIAPRRSVVCTAFASLLPTVAARTSTPLVVVPAIALVLESFASAAHLPAAAAASTFSFTFAFISLLSFLSWRLASA